MAHFSTRGHYAYFGLPSNSRLLSLFLWEVGKIWFRALRRRSQKRNLTWDGFNDLLKTFPLPHPRITHPCDYANPKVTHLRRL